MWNYRKCSNTPAPAKLWEQWVTCSPENTVILRVNPPVATHRGRWAWGRPTCPVWCSGSCSGPPGGIRHGSCNAARCPPPGAPPASPPPGRSPGTSTLAGTAALETSDTHSYTGGVALAAASRPLAAASRR